MIPIRGYSTIQPSGAELPEVRLRGRSLAPANTAALSVHAAQCTHCRGALLPGHCARAPRIVCPRSSRAPRIPRRRIAAAFPVHHRRLSTGHSCSPRNGDGARLSAVVDPLKLPFPAFRHRFVRRAEHPSVGHRPRPPAQRRAQRPGAHPRNETQDIGGKHAVKGERSCMCPDASTIVSSRFS